MDAIKRSNKLKNIQGPFIIDQYNVKGMMYQKEGNVFARFINNLIEGLNEFHRIPRIILFIPDNAFIKGIKHEEFGVSKMLGICLNHVLKQVDKLIDRKKQLMNEIKPGSITASEPKFIWVKMFDRPGKGDKSMKQRDKFNAILEEALSTRNHSYIIDVNKAMFAACFDRYSYLTPVGKENFWLEIDRQIKGFDRQEISLKPSAVITEAHEAREKAKLQKKKKSQVKSEVSLPRRLLPAPPPKHQPKRHNDKRRYRQDLAADKITVQWSNQTKCRSAYYRD